MVKPKKMRITPPRLRILSIMRGGGFIIHEKGDRYRLDGYPNISAATIKAMFNYGVFKPNNDALEGESQTFGLSEEFR